jgi:type I restriction enzyme S subunit
MVTYPSDWTPMQLKDLGHIQMCRRIFQNQTKEYGAIPFYKISTFGNKADAYISRDLYEKYKALYPYPEKGDVLISAAGTVGKTVIFDGKDSYFQDSNIVWLKVNKELIDRKFLWWFFRSYPWEALEGTTIQRLYNNIILKTSINLPPIPEQKEIAKTLSTFDTYIDDLSELIEKKKSIRDGALIDLISGRTRLEGFDYEWDNGKIGDILKILHGKSQRGVESYNGKYPILGTGGVIGKATEYLCDWECVLIGRKGTIDKPIYMNSPFWTIDTLYYSKPVKNQCVKFQYYLFCTIPWYDYTESSGRPSLSRKVIENIPIRIPKYEEQQAIASVLTAMDKEIENLEAERDKMIQIREGAMDDLLTGRVRLTV